LRLERIREEETAFYDADIEDDNIIE